MADRVYSIKDAGCRVNREELRKLCTEKRTSSYSYKLIKQRKSLQEIMKGLNNSITGITERLQETCRHPYDKVEVHESYYEDDWAKSSTTTYRFYCGVCGTQVANQEERSHW